MRKKIMSFILAGTMVCVTLTGCGLTNGIVEQTQQEIDEAKENLQEETKELSGDIDELNESLSSAGEDISKIVNDTINGTSEEDDQMKADEVADLIDSIYVQERTDETDAQCKAAKEAWDALTDAQKELVEGEDADSYSVTWKDFEQYLIDDMKAWE